ncbi:MAG: hypothetical protein HY518_01835 [Candidatus Aenigmarchaeota archaeon]|nr:hypothetical protein [Candidatus Aenigmarchaeota archaeon]
MAIVYMCCGSCQGAVNQETFNKGKTKCLTRSCERFGRPFQKVMQCTPCERETSKDEKPQCCDNCIPLLR